MFPMAKGHDSLRESKKTRIEGIKRRWEISKGRGLKGRQTLYFSGPSCSFKEMCIHTHTHTHTHTDTHTHMYVFSLYPWVPH